MPISSKAIWFTSRPVTLGSYLLSKCTFPLPRHIRSTSYLASARSIRTLLMPKSEMWAPTMIVSPIVWKVTLVSSTSTFAMFIFHLKSLFVVSSGRVSRKSATSISQPFRRTPSTSASSRPRSMPRLDNLSFSTLPLTLREEMKPSVLNLALFNSILSTTTTPLNKGHNFTSVTSVFTSAMVSRTLARLSLGLMNFTSSRLRSNGNFSATFPTPTSAPVFSDIYTATFCTRKFCTEGIYRIIVKTKNKTKGLNNMTDVHNRNFFI